MSAGLRVFNANGDLRVEIIDRLTRIHSQGTYQAPEGSGAFPRVEVAVPGMTPDGSWFVVVTGTVGIANPVIVQNGKFVVICMDRFGGFRPINRYTVYRC